MIAEDAHYTFDSYGTRSGFSDFNLAVPGNCV